MSGFQVLVLTMLDHESLAAHASRRSRRSLLSVGLLFFNELDLILRRSPTGRANARPMTGSVAVSKDGLQYRFVIPGTSAVALSRSGTVFRWISPRARASEKRARLGNARGDPSLWRPDATSASRCNFNCG